MVRVIVYAIAGSVGGGLVGVLVSLLTKGAFAPFIMLSFIMFGLLGGVLAILVNVRDRKKFVGSGNGQMASPALTTAPLPPPPAPLPKWVVAVFKVYGFLNFAIVLVGFVALVSSVAVVGGIPPFRAIIFFVVMAAYSLTVGFGSWYLKRWVVPLFGFVFLTNFASLFIGGVSVASFQAVPAAIISAFVFGLGYKYRDGLSGGMVSLLPQLLFIITGILILVFPRVFPAVPLSGESDSVSGVSDTDGVTDTLPIKDWKQYVNSDIGVNFSYPSFFELSEERGGGSDLLVSLRSSQVGKPYFIFEINPLPKGLEGRNMEYHLREGGGGQIVVMSREVFDLGEYFGKPQLDYPNVINAFAELHASRGDYFSWRFGSDPHVGEYEDLFEQILETFRINDSQSPLPVSGGRGGLDIEKSADSYKETAKDLAVRSRMFQLRALSEVHLNPLKGNVYENFSESSAEVVRLAEEIEERGGKLGFFPSVPTTYFVAYSRLPSNLSLFYCVDSALSFKIVQAAPSSEARSCP